MDSVAGGRKIKMRLRLERGGMERTARRTPQGDLYYL